MTINDLAEKLKKLKSAQIFCHVRPDGDTLSCAFSLKRAFDALGIKVEVVSVDGVPPKYSVCEFFDKSVTELKEGFDGYIAVDCAAADMLAANERAFLKQKNTYVIDHHGTNTRFGKENLVLDLASCSMIVFEVIKAMGVKIDKTLADMLLIGLVTDTGNFAHTNTDARALSAASELVELGADMPEIYRLMFKSQPKERAQLYIEVMSKMRFFGDDRIAVIYTSREMLDRYGLDRSATEGFVDFPMSIGSVEVAVAIMDAGKNAYKISLRSKTVNVAEIAASFGGGGHKNASGLQLFGFYEDVVDKLVFTIKNYL